MAGLLGGRHRTLRGPRRHARGRPAPPVSSSPARWPTASASTPSGGRWTVRRGLVATAITVPHP
ncbi:hypothetical protein ACRAWF_06420 [Streptomyces sp. L7]